jgi:hypothetical protein
MTVVRLSLSGKNETTVMSTEKSTMKIVVIGGSGP